MTTFLRRDGDPPNAPEIGSRGRRSRDAVSAAEALRAALALPDTAQPVAASTEVRAVTRTAFAKMISATPEHVTHLIRRGRIPTNAIVGEGRGLRILVGAALAALKPTPLTDTPQDPSGDEIERAGAEYIRRRRKLR